MKKIIITGSSSGIGQSISQELLAQGHQVIGIARNHQKFMPDNERYFPTCIDLADMVSLENHLKQLRDHHADVDTIICNAGYGRFAELEQFSIVQIQDLMTVNFTSHVILIKSFLPLMKQRKQGKIIFIGSDAALEGQKKGSIYCAAKFALRGFSQSLRKECASANIGVTMINPGMVNSPFYQELYFRPGNLPENFITVEQITETVQLILNAKSGVFDEINLSPMKKVIEKT